MTTLQSRLNIGIYAKRKRNTEDDLTDPRRFGWREGKPLWIMVAANTFWHYEEHATAIRTWMESLSAEQEFHAIDEEVEQ